MDLITDMQMRGVWDAYTKYVLEMEPLLLVAPPGSWRE
jgi:hypothetical protein